MLIDSLVSFVPLGSPLSLVAAAGVNIASPNMYDFAGVGAGVAPPDIWGTPTSFGQPDAMGVGGARPELVVAIGVAPTTSNSATLNAALQAAADNGSNQPSTWYTIGESGAQAVANLTANTVFCRLPWLPPFPANLRPRFLRMLFQVPSATNFSAGSINYALVVPPGGRDDLFNKYMPKNFLVQ
jgi:hypothetical protein